MRAFQSLLRGITPNLCHIWTQQVGGINFWTLRVLQDHPANAVASQNTLQRTSLKDGSCLKYDRESC